MLKTAILGCLIVSSSIVSANAATYQYTGDNYTLVTGPYDTSMNITGYFSVDAPLSASTYYNNLVPSSYSFFDGINTYTTGLLELDIITDSLGAFEGVFVELFNLPDDYLHIGTSPASTYTYHVDTDSGGYVATSGEWSAVPIPAALPLLASP